MRLIDADELLKKFCHGCPDNDNGDNCIMNHCADYDLVLTMPTIEAEPVKHGRWLPSDKGDCTYICSECGFVRDAYILEEKAYCPNCGTRMDAQIGEDKSHPFAESVMMGMDEVEE